MGHYSSTPAVSLGRASLTLIGSSNDDSTQAIPNIGFDFMYNSTNVRSTIATSGNSFISLGGNTVIYVNQRDASYNNLYGGVENGGKQYRIRWEGQKQYSSWNSNDLIWEITFYNTGYIQLVIEKIGTPNGTCQLFGTSVTFADGKSFLMSPNDTNGTSWTVQEGSYVDTFKMLVLNTADGNVYSKKTGSWVNIGAYPIDEQVYIDNGMEAAPSYADIISLVGNTGKIRILQASTDFSSNTAIKTKGIPQGTVVVQKGSLDITIDNNIDSINTIVFYGTATDSNLQIALSIDDGVSWSSFKGGAWQAVDINNISDFKAKGMTKTELQALTNSQFKSFMGSSKKIKSALYIELSDVAEIFNVNSLAYNYKLIS